eukprot:TRINITY_DN10195_c0_g1_i1.p1 TRINITY_DN10195_c0_g1~~TRINITY_DN10195_c0_g1_i1.p1  ORF type:complete len:624 (+),score=168.98 TRINITY_DN10195_c0_g1_i1:265-2136(+)
MEADVVTDAFCEFLHESRIMHAMCHPSVVQILGICVRPVAVLMELLPLGDLYHLIDVGTHETDLKALTRVQSTRAQLENLELKLLVALDIARGLEHMHAQSPPIAHRDVRSPNIFVLTLEIGAPVRVKVGDFGLSRRPCPTLSGGEFNPNWLAPEVMLGEEYDHRMDIYGFGVIAWELLSLARPFAEYDDEYGGKPQQTFKNAVVGGLRPTIPPEAPPRLAKLIESCWHAVPSARPSMSEAVKEIEEMLIEMGKPLPQVCTTPRRIQSGQMRPIPVLLEQDKLLASFDDVLLVEHHSKLKCKHPHTINDICPVGPSNTVWALCNDGTIRIWQSDGQLVKIVQDVKDSKVEIVFRAVVVPTCVVVGADQGTLLLYSFKGEMKRRIKSKETKHEKDVRSVILVRGGRDGADDRVWTASVDGVISMWKGLHKGPKHIKVASTVRIHSNKESRGVFCMEQFNGKVYIGTSHGEIMMLSLSGEVEAEWQAHRSSVYRLISTSRHLWSCARRDEVMKVWDGEHAEPVTEVCGHKSQVMSMLYANDVVWSGAFDTGDTALILWDPDTFHALQLANKDQQGKPVHKDGVKSLALVGEQVWAGGSETDPAIALWSYTCAASSLKHRAPQPPG